MSNLNKTAETTPEAALFITKKPVSFTVSPQKGIYKCFGCGKGGDAVKFIMEHEHVEYREAMDHWRQKAEPRFRMEGSAWATSTTWNTSTKRSLRIVCSKAATYFQECITNNLVASNYLKERNFETSAEDPFMIGYAPKGNTLMKWAEDKGLNRHMFIDRGRVGWF